MLETEILYKCIEYYAISDEETGSWWIEEVPKLRNIVLMIYNINA
jgi:hypothetical protein